MKAYTSQEQSKKLAEILPIESADCYWDYDEMQKFHRISWFEDGFNKHSQLLFNENNVCAWSLAALLDLLPNNEYITTTIARGGWKVDTMEYCDKWWCEYEDDDNINNFSISADNPIDACYEMILNLHEQKLL